MAGPIWALPMKRFFVFLLLLAPFFSIQKSNLEEGIVYCMLLNIFQVLFFLPFLLLNLKNKIVKLNCFKFKKMRLKLI